MTGQTAEFNPICPLGMAELVLIVFGYLTTLFTVEPPGTLVHVENPELPFVAPVAPVFGIAMPSDSENDGPVCRSDRSGSRQ